MDKKYVEWIYNSLMGSLAEEYSCKEVENLFLEGSPCMKLYSDAIEAYWNLCDRLGVEEDQDGQVIISSLLEMTKIVSCRMFEYGVKFGGQK